MNGGEIIATGGYGCVFKPSLKCKSSKKKFSEKNKNFVSKLLINKHAIEELSEINIIKPILSEISNNNNYFLVSELNYCTPDIISEKDKKNINKCKKFFEKNDIDINNINNELNKFTLINSPYGGEDLEKYIFSNNFNITKFQDLNKLLINLLKYAIIPMNKLNLYHMDLKDQNILYLKNNIKIIDWGLSFINKGNNYLYNNINFNNNLYRRPLQFNLPYSILILNNDFWKDFINYKNYYTNIEKKKLNKDTYKDIFKNIFHNFFENLKYGHNQDITNAILPLFYNNLNTDEDKFNQFIEIMVNIYIAIFLKYYDTNSNTFQINEYIKNIYLNNCDIFGLLSIYISIYDSLLKKNCDVEPIKIIVKKYMFDEKYYIQQYNLPELYEDLKNLNIKMLSNNHSTIENQKLKASKKKSSKKIIKKKSKASKKKSKCKNKS